jgi:hypothetical protein
MSGDNLPCAASGVGLPCDNEAKDTTQESTPERRCSAKSSGASPDMKGHDRLVTSIDARTDAPEALCPLCGRPGSGTANDNGWGVGTANYLCDAGHLFSTRWLIVGGAA